MPTPWDGTEDDLPAGWDEAFPVRSRAAAEADVLCALAISVIPTGSRTGCGAHAERDAQRGERGGLQ